MGRAHPTSPKAPFSLFTGRFPPVYRQVFPSPEAGFSRKEGLFKTDCLLLHGLRHVIDVKGERTVAQFGSVEGLEVIIVKRRMGLRQTEGLMGLSVAVDIAEIRFAIKTIVTFGGENKPTRVA